MKKALITILVLGIIGAGAYGAYYHFYKDKGDASSERVSSSSEDAVYVDLVSAITGYGSGNGLIDRYGGEIEPQATLEVKLENDRKVKECFVKEGDEVKEGQRLFVYDTQDDEDKVAQAQIDIEKAQGDMELSEKQIAQLEKEKAKASADDQLTYTTNILSEQNSIKQNEYEIKSKQLELEQLKESIANATVTAEMGGIIQKISDPNSSDSNSYGSSSSGSAYITILAVGDFRVKGTANEQSINQGKIYPGMPVIVYSRVDSTQTWHGEVSEVKDTNDEDSSDSGMYYYGSSDNSSSKYTFYVELESSDNLILGQHVYMEEDIGQNDKKDGLWLEEYYIMQEDGHAYVWRANASNVLEKHEVTLGEYDEELMKYEITDGLEAEDYIAYPTGLVEEGAPVIYNDYSTGGDSSMMEGIEDIAPDEGDIEAEPYYGDEEDDLGAGMFEFGDGGSIEGPEGYDEEVFDADADMAVGEDY